MSVEELVQAALSSKERADIDAAWAGIEKLAKEDAPFETVATHAKLLIEGHMGLYYYRLPQSSKEKWLDRTTACYRVLSWLGAHENRPKLNKFSPLPYKHQ